MKKLRHLKYYENFIPPHKKNGKELYDNNSGSEFWGNIGAGVLPICINSKRILLDFRSAEVNEPHTWGIWGGKLDEDVENESGIKQVALREFEEETNYKGKIELIDAYIFKAPGGVFTYYNFIGLLDHEFEPTYSWETEGFKWVTLAELDNMSDIHFGLAGLLENSRSIIEKYCK